jgi:hypothetical protein
MIEIDRLRRTTVALTLLSSCVFPGCGDDDPVPDPEDVAVELDGAVSDAGGCLPVDDSELCPDGGTPPRTISVNPAHVFGLEELSFDTVVGITDFRFLPVPGLELIALEQTGRMLHLSLEGTTLTLLGEFNIDVHIEQACGLISLVLDPDFETNHYLWLSLCTSRQFSGIYRITFDPEDYAGIADTRVEIINAGDDLANRSWHNVGTAGFNADGNMWVFFGEKNRGRNAQDTTNNLGSMLLISPNREPDGSGYEPVAGNPFYGSETNSPDLYSWGLRSPWRAFIDPRERIWIGDVGSTLYEELNLITEPGQNFGWNLHEGPCESDCEGLTDPLIAWPRGDDDTFGLEDPDIFPVSGRVGYAALWYSPRGRDRYDGHLTDIALYGDRCRGYVRGMTLDEDNQVDRDFHVGHIQYPTAVRQGPDGYIYATTYASCGSDPPDAPSSMYRALLNSNYSP